MHFWRAGAIQLMDSYECAGLVDWLLSPRLSRRQSAPADECAGLVDELLSPQVTRRQSAPADECAGLVDDSAGGLQQHMRTASVAKLRSRWNRRP